MQLREKGGKVPDHRNVSVLQLTLQGILLRLVVRLGIDFVCYNIHPSGGLFARVIVSNRHSK